MRFLALSCGFNLIYDNNFNSPETVGFLMTRMWITACILTCQKPQTWEFEKTCTNMATIIGHTRVFFGFSSKFLISVEIPSRTISVGVGAGCKMSLTSTESIKSTNLSNEMQEKQSLSCQKLLFLQINMLAVLLKITPQISRY